MSDPLTIQATETSSRRDGILRATAAVLLIAYVVLFVVLVPKSWPEPVVGCAQQAKGFVLDGVDATLVSVSHVKGYSLIRSTVFLLLVLGVFPYVAIAVIRRGRPAAFGMRRWNRIGKRAIVIGYLVSIPFTVWVVHGDEFAKYYRDLSAQSGMAILIVFFLVNLTTEHFLLQGVVLALVRPGLRWPDRVDVIEDAEGGWRSVLQWCGLCQPTGDARGLKRWTRWAGLPDGCVAALAVSTLLFALVHCGKDIREIFASIPGGLAMAYLAYRTNTWLTPVVIHGLAAVTSFVLAVMLH